MVATMLRFALFAKPVERMRNVPVFASIIVPVASAVLHWLAPFAGMSSTAYWAVEPGMFTRCRGSAPVPFQAWLTFIGAGTFVQRAQYPLSSLSWNM